LRDFWADIAVVTLCLIFPTFHYSLVYFEQFGAITADGKPALIDNNTTLLL